MNKTIKQKDKLVSRKGAKVAKNGKAKSLFPYSVYYAFLCVLCAFARKALLCSGLSLLKENNERHQYAHKQ